LYVVCAGILTDSDFEFSEMDTVESSICDMSVLRDEVKFILDVSQFYNQEALSDIVLKVGDKRYYSHKFVLAKSSDVFRTMLYEKNWSQGSKDEIILEETPDCQQLFDKFLRYLYTAEVSISNATAVAILCLADKYNVISLKELCAHYMCIHSQSPRLHNALRWYSWAKMFQLDTLLRQCYRTIAWNYMEFLSSPDWSSAEIDFLRDFLQSSELIVINEFAVWNGVRLWLTHESRMHQFSENVQLLLPLVRFPQMLVPQLYQLEKSELAAHVDCKDLFHELLSRAYRFRALCPIQSSLGVSFNEPFYLPRDYVDLIVDTVRIQSTMRFGIQVGCLA
jgi:BTB/POZ domain-containing protein 17